MTPPPSPEPASRSQARRMATQRGEAIRRGPCVCGKSKVCQEHCGFCATAGEPCEEHRVRSPEDSSDDPAPSPEQPVTDADAQEEAWQELLRRPHPITLGEAFDAGLKHGRARYKERIRELEKVVSKLMHLDSRLRLRSPATQAEIHVWAGLREDARALLGEVPDAK